MKLSKKILISSLMCFALALPVFANICNNNTPQMECLEAQNYTASWDPKLQDNVFDPMDFGGESPVQGYFSRASSSKDPTSVNSGTPQVRLYPNNTMTIYVEDGFILQKIDIDYTTYGSATDTHLEYSTDEENTWESLGESGIWNSDGIYTCQVVFKAVSSANSSQVRITGVSVDYSLDFPSGPELIDISIVGEPLLKTYVVGQSFNTAGLSVEGTYSDSTKKEITDGIVWSTDPQTFIEANSNATVVVTANVSGYVANYTVENVNVLSGIEGDFRYSLNFSDNNPYIRIDKYLGSSATVKVPATISGLPVKEISQEAFAQNTTVTSIEISEGIEKILANAFLRCENLVSISLPSTLKVIDMTVFSRCKSLTEIAIPANVSIGGQAFDRCTGLKTIVFGAGVSLAPVLFSSDNTVSRIQFLGNYSSIDKLAFMYIGGNCDTTLILPSDWTGSLPKSSGEWCEGVFKTVAYSRSITNNAPSSSQSSNHGCISVANEAISGEEVYIDIYPSKGYELKKLTCVSLPDTDVPVTKDETTGKYHFTMPNSDVVIDAEFAAHDYAGQVTYTWNQDKTSCTASRPCVNPGCEQTETETVDSVYVVDNPATCTSNEKGHYEATFKTTGFEKQVTPVVEKPNSATGHDFSKNVKYEWNVDHSKCTASVQCSHTGCNETQTETVNSVYVKDFDATCSANEKGHYEATFTVQGFTKQETLMFDKENTSKGHDFVITYTWNEDKTACTAHAECSKGDCSLTNEGTITVEDGYAVATFEDSEFETQRVKLPEPEPAPKKNNVNPGAVAGITIGSIFGLLIIIFIVLYILWKLKDIRIPLLEKILTPAYRWINNLLFKTKLNNVEKKDAEEKQMSDEDYLKANK